ncbi:acylneuraminate cytidylyltransferase family protein [Candidatus Synechococcus calcipolaris G9]|uniref:Acylneuraminate cytidylyltransferase family protein n=1 Tax=Candidatus Synechococcus calcipolaris G9 TaxID=1497997 RepID=A0ABT6F3F1_9SYNE|nr:acylneuraminate cytidylyltransferase family protein [Candidatus Synechococcus calcipolaris]MDG2992385.1 acylneuraminate cytidylyltransferase family protein [Candidatus Synechococcus calcipolaris G9]
MTQRICTICARAGSKGVKNKNIRDLHGKPLIAYTVEQAIKSQLFELIAVSSDSKKILDIAQSYGVNILVDRPSNLATDSSSKLNAIRHCVETVEYLSKQKTDIVVDLDVTSPLRLPEDIKGAVNLLEAKNIGNVITGSPARRSPYFNLVELGHNNVVRLVKSLNKPIIRRQDSPACFDMNASVYVWRRDILFNYPTIFNIDTQIFVMPEERSIDIDTELDFEIVEFLIRRRVGV